MNVTVFEAINITKKYRNTLALNQVSICCLYVFSGASVYLMLWSDMETVSIPLKFFVYGNPMYYWMNFSSCRTMGIIEHLPFYFIGCISLLIVGGLIMIRKEIK